MPIATERNPETIEIAFSSITFLLKKLYVRFCRVDLIQKCPPDFFPNIFIDPVRLVD